MSVFGLNFLICFDVVSIALRFALNRDDSSSGLKSVTLIALYCEPKLSCWAADREARWALSLALRLVNRASFC